MNAPAPSGRAAAAKRMLVRTRRVTYAALAGSFLFAALSRADLAFALPAALVSLLVFVLGLVCWIASALFGLLQFSLAWLLAATLGVGFCVSLLVALPDELKWIGLLGLALLSVVLLDWYLRDYLARREHAFLREIIEEARSKKPADAPGTGRKEPP